MRQLFCLKNRLGDKKIVSQTRKLSADNFFRLAEVLGTAAVSAASAAVFGIVCGDNQQHVGRRSLRFGVCTDAPSAMQVFTVA